MEFIKHHYEKLILMVMLLVFIFTMVHVLLIIRQTKEIRESDLQIPKKAPDYVIQDPDAQEYQIDKFWTASTLDWQASQARDARHNANHFADLCLFPEVAVCPHCGKLIPFYYFKDGRSCPECTKELRTPPERPKGRRNIITSDDSDGDGIPDVDENKYGLDPKNAGDAQDDLDGDGFSNIYEIEQGTNPKSPRSHPPLWHRLRFAKIERVELPIKFMALTAEGDDPAKWDIQLNEPRRNRRGVLEEKTILTNLNSEIKIDKIMYRIVKIDRRQRELVKTQETKERTAKMVDESVLYLIEILPEGSTREPEKLEMQVGKAAYTSDRRPILIDTGTRENKQFVLRVGERFRMGDRTVGFADYILSSCDEKKFLIQLENPKAKAKQDPKKDASGTLMVVTREGKIPDDSRVIFREQSATGNAAGGEIAPGPVRNR